MKMISISNLQNGKYRIESLLGSGGFGNTYLATQVALGRKVAIKEFYMKEFCERDEATSQVIIPTEGSRKIVDRYRRKFLKEAQMIASLKDEHIIQIYDIFEENNTAYYVMEYVEGGSLKDKVERQGALAEDVAIRYVSQVSEALSYLHSNNILHLDIKPSNILIDRHDGIILIDFGISKHYDADGEQTSTTPVGISKGYAPIEQYQQGSISGFSPSTDIYSLGATLYFLLTGLTPPEASIVNEDGLPGEIDRFSLQLKKVVTKCMASRRKDRYQSTEEFISSISAKDRSRDTYGVSDTNEKTRVVSVAPKRKQEDRLDVRPELSQNLERRSPKVLIVAAMLVVGVLTAILINEKHSGFTKENEAIAVVEPNLLNVPDFAGMTLPDPKALSYTLKQESRKENNITDDDVWMEKYKSPEQGMLYNFPESWKNPANDTLKSKVPPTVIGKFRNSVHVNSQYNVIYYGDKSPYHGDVSLNPDVIIVTDPTFTSVLYAYDFSNFSVSKFAKPGEENFTQVSVGNVQIEDDVLYATVGHSTYAASSSGFNAYLVAVDLKTHQIKWVTKPLTSNADFCIYGASIITGYGFTDEPDYIYIIDKATGCRVKSIRVANGPEYFSVKDNKLYVRTYSFDYVYGFEKPQKVSTNTSSTTHAQSTVLTPPKPVQESDDVSLGVEIMDYVEVQEEVVEEEAIPFQLVEEKPSFQGGDANQFSKWVNSRLVYPEIAKENGAQGRVTLQFTVEKDGSVTKVKVLRGVDPYLDKEAVRVVSMSPKWKPGKQRDRVVPVTYTFPIIFLLN